MNDKAHISKLPNSPLQEVIFELLLEDEVDENGNPTEEKYDLAQGVFAKDISKDFPFRVSNKYPNGIRLFPRIVHQFWKDKNKWPVIQIGPGIITVNDTDTNYEWEKFFPLVNQCLDQMEASLGEELKIKKAVLRYVDAVELDEADSDKKIEYVNEKFNIQLNNNFTLREGKMIGLNINQSFALKDGSVVNFSITNGKSKKNQPAIVWQTLISINTIDEKIGIKGWLDYSHSIVSQLFKDTITKEFYEQFN